MPPTTPSSPRPLAAARGLKPAPVLPELSSFRLRISLAGMPFVGRSTCSRFLQERFNVAVIDPERLVVAAMEAAASYTEALTQPPPPAAPAAEPSSASLASAGGAVGGLAAVKSSATLGGMEAVAEGGPAAPVAMASVLPPEPSPQVKLGLQAIQATSAGQKARALTRGYARISVHPPPCTQP